MTAPAIKQFVIVDPAEAAVDESKSPRPRRTVRRWKGNLIGLGGGTAVAWAEVTDKPSTFTPAAHTHDIAEVNGLQDGSTWLDARITAIGEAGA